MSLVLVEIRPSHDSRVELQGDQTIGRERCEVIVDNPLVSRQHAALRTGRDTVILEDLGSRNGTFVNDQQIDGPRELAPGDEIRIGETVWRVEQARAPATELGSSPASAGAPTMRGDVPPPPAPSIVEPAPAQAGAPPFETPSRFERPKPKRRASAARRLEATLISYAVVLLTAVGVVAYLATR
jgi:predicted component of type VI protein secretion system